MLRLIPALALALLMQTPAPLTLTFIGNEAVQITDGSTTLVSDFPYRSGYSGYMTYDFGTVAPPGKVLCLITHRHPDHFEPSLLAKTSWQVMAPGEPLGPVESPRALPLGQSFGPIQIEPQRTPHARLEHYSYRVTWGGRRFYFVGDTESPDALLDERGLDIAFVTPWLYRAAVRTGRTIDAKKIVIYHQQSGEQVPTCDRCVALRQGETMTID